ncbi:MAG TPA: signal recognition particle receptor subunit alpha [Candidatus Pacearchaeota archaeon]|jgi:signal recognition particle subunit SRP54|nr:signal recognition particle protein [Candidatus Pacearchaeota archaeon]HNZ51961.1 signal recognition particle receptor subunit alpha [Candidatus Pacearchaeota archaeon]HOC96700.1 signal recognition particle receptor subunit alpha [Candidatus Pacearchaeota archaeon]HOF43887.1 signal recognition particle receptor subunit alpha [Candidatus Pacearchaeota archaeon]HOH04040.1 signal recognition particle receptor subunit alpha [Candidatus Pacearchaeota archaeon]
MLEKLGEALRKARDKLANALFLDKNLVESVVKELQRALIEADVNIILVKDISDKIKKAAYDERIKEIEKKEHIIKLLHDELVKILGEYKTLELPSGKQSRIMFLGLYGAGKTTTIAKLGNWYSKRGKKVIMVGLDVHRPAAKEQLEQLGKKNNIPCFVDFDETDAVKTWKKFEKKHDLKKYDLILVDTAGRHTLDKELIKEIKELNKEIKTTETILVMPADIGQAAKKQASEFQEALKISGVIITRMDSTAKGGGALTACAETKAGVYYITTGEKINDIEEFNPESFLSRLLGMGDLQALIEKIRSVTDEDQQEKMQKRLEEGKLSLEDVIEQVKSMNQIGGFDKIKGMIPGLGKAKIPEGMLESQQEKIAKWEHILKSMTKEERENPELFDKQTSRIGRVAKGAGVNNSDIRALLKQYKMLQDLVKGGMTDMDMSKGFSQKQMQRMMKKFGKKKMMRFK